jgi:hypothetical protein
MNNNNPNKPRREFLKTSAAAVAGLGLFGFDLKAGSLSTGLSPFEDLPATHNMMIVGEKTAYLSHLPMFVIEGEPPTFDSPHRFQVILEATFTQGTRDLTASYFKDRANNPNEKMYTLNPARFVLSRVNSRVPLKRFRGNTVFRGHLEREGQPFIGFTGSRPPAGGVFDVNVKNVVHFHQFSKQATKPDRLEYLLFGKGTELFMNHFITRPNDFDQIISVKIDGQSLTEAQLSKGMHVVIAERGNTALERIKEKQSVSARFMVPGGAPRTLTVEATREFYFEEGELAVPPNFDPTPEETKAGFG